jgi:hypothetical protein
VKSLVLDVGAFIGWEHGDDTVRAYLAAGRRLGLTPLTISPVIAQVWRDGSRQAMLARLVKAVEVLAPTLEDAQRAGELCRSTKTTDVVDALLVTVCRPGSTVLTSDPGDLKNLVEAADLLVNITKV